MRRTILLTATLSLIAAQSPWAGTFERARIAPDLGLDALTRGVARAQLGRDLFADPYATVTLGTLDVYAVFPYVESRTWQIVSDPRWNRLVVGEAGQSLGAWDGAGTAVGALRDPRGLAVDENGRVFVADAGNDRVVVLHASGAAGALTLTPLYAIGGLHDPHGVAVADGGTPFAPDDDVLYVADTGRNRLVAFALGAAGARQVAEIGELGSGAGHFAGPMAVAAGREPVAGGREVFVADAHTRRIVRLRHDAAGLHWDAEITHDADVVTSLDTDRWGNLYAAAPNRGVVRKFNRELEPVAELRSDLARPRDVHVPFLTVTDHRDGHVTRVGQASAVTLDQWGDATGMRLWTLAPEVTGLALTSGDAPGARFTLTDRADVALEIVDAADGRRLATRAAGTFDAGTRTIALTAADLDAAAGASQPQVRLVAASGYPGGATARAQIALAGYGGGPVVNPGQLTALPNPVRTSTRIAFALPAGAPDGASLRIFDASGRQVRQFAQRFSAGVNQVTWDGTDDRGRRLPDGIYFSRLRAAGRETSHRMVLVR
jgi:DNA-binding beta-propeller fold protein YncE